ncbi:hypothetical protein BC941DRAFT_519531 [Chlamydoabsidia padenii]|nr:hypothetical protein BC941DRAFT_519531 [Chlamydoabsidia padenii]
MPYKLSRTYKRRGRPRRSGRHLQAAQLSHQHLHQQGSIDKKVASHLTEQALSLKGVNEHHHSLPSSTLAFNGTANNNKPREERSYKDFFPDLDIKLPLTIIRRTDSMNSLAQETTTTTTSSSSSSLSSSIPPPPQEDTTKIIRQDSPIDTPATPPPTAIIPAPLPPNNPSKSSSPSSSSPSDSIHTSNGSCRSYGDLDDVSDLSKDEISDDTITNSTPDETTMVTTTSTTLTSTNTTDTIIDNTALPSSMESNHSMEPTLWSDHPIMIRGSRKKGDTYQALSTRSQPHHTTASGAVDLATLPKPCFEKVVDDGYDSGNNKKRRKVTQKHVTTKTRGRAKKMMDGEQDNDMDGETDDLESDKDGNTDSDGDVHKLVHYRRPENHYIRYIEPTEEFLFDMVEYDMDEQDEAWLQMLNAERKKEGLGEVSCSFFENVIDKLEKEWFDLIKHLPKRTDTEPILPEDSACSICDDGECENSNAIVFCDGCNLAVHQDCYGVPYIPEGQWLCRKCMVSPDKPVSCLFCPNEGGAFKQTNTNKWGHLLCAIWIPEVGVSNSVYMEPIDNIDSIPKSRWKLTCYLCKKRHGACIQCDNKHCFTAFHVTCARWARLCMRMKSHGTHYDSVLLKAYCDRHTPRDYRDEVDVEKCVLAAQEFLDPKSPKNRGRSSSSFTPRRRYVDTMDKDFDMDNNLGDGDNEEDGYGDDESGVEDNKSDGGSRQHQSRYPKGTKRRKTGGGQKQQKQLKGRRQAITVTQQLTPSIKAAMAHQHHYSAGAPIAPDYILTRLENIKCVRNATHLRRRAQLVSSICRYWSLKRESRRGAPLLKRLHLEPWTASSSQLKQTEREKLHRASAMMKLRSDLEHVRMLSEQVQKREKQKLERLRRQKEYIETILFPIEYIIKPVLNQLMELDKKEYFLYPVTPDVAPDYHEIIDTPMCFSDIIDKFHAHKYTTLDAVEFDLSLIWINCKTYNKSDTSYYKLAQRMEEESAELMAKARQKYEQLAISAYVGTLALGLTPDIFSYELKAATPLIAGGDDKSTDEESIQSDKPISLEPSEPDELSQSSQNNYDAAIIYEDLTRDQGSRPTAIPSTRTRLKKRFSPSTRRTRSTSSQSTHTSLDDRPPKPRKPRNTILKSPTPSTLAPLPTAKSSASPEDINEATTTTNLVEIPTEPSHPLRVTNHATPSGDESAGIVTIPSPSTIAPPLKEPMVASPIIISPSPSSPASSTPSNNSSRSSSSSTSTRSDQLKSEANTTRRRTRSAGSEGLTILTKSRTKDLKMNNETKRLLMTDTVTNPVAYEEGSYKKSKTKRAPCGYVYLSTDEEDYDDGNGNDSGGTNQPPSTTKTSTQSGDTKLGNNRNKRRRSSSSSSSMALIKKKKELLKPLKELCTTTPGEIVWARVPSFPFHPAMIVNLEKDPVSRHVLNNRTKEKNILVKFYKVPEIHQWGWVRPMDIYKFGNEENDRIMLEQAKLTQKSKKARLQEVWDGYKYVCQQHGFKLQRL